MADDMEESRILAEEIESYPLTDSMYEFSVKIASTRFGQLLIRNTDKVLRTFENTAKWSLPQTKQIESDPSETTLPPPTLIRPLPWILFLPALIALRFLRIALSLIAIMLAQEAITPSDIVRFAQVRRRKLRAIKYQGLRQIRTNNYKDKTNKTGILGKFYGVINKLMCTRNEIEETVEIIVTNKNQSSSTNNDNNISKKRHLNEVDDDSTDEKEEKTILYELLDKSLSSESSEDSSFDINDETESETENSMDEESDTEDAIITKNCDENNKNSSPNKTNNCGSEQNNKIENNHKTSENELNHNSSSPVNCNSPLKQKSSPKIDQNGGFDEVKVNSPPEQYTNNKGSSIPDNKTEQINENSEIYEMKIDSYDNENNNVKIEDRRPSSAIPIVTSTTNKPTATTNNNNNNNNNIKTQATSLNDVRNNFHTNLKQNNNHRRSNHGSKKSNKKN